MDRLKKLIKPNVLSLEPYSSARDENQATDGIFLDANENPYDFEYNRYPDPYQRELKSKISGWRNIDCQFVFLGNGSDEVIDLLIRATCTEGKDRILSLDPSYGMYKVSSAVNNIKIDLVPMNTDLDVDTKALFDILDNCHKLIFICSPNNPNGGTIDSNIIEKVLISTDNLVIVDEAYIDFADADSWIDRLVDYPNLIVLQTFSKSLGAAGIRLGIGFMNPYLVEILNKIKPPYNISIPNQEAAISRLENISSVNEFIAKIKRNRSSLKNELERLSIVEHVFPSEANFLLARFSNHKAVYDSLTAQGIVVRDRSNNRNCENCLRISIGTEQEIEQLLTMLKTLS